ncbi:MAG: universal stress protein [Nitrosomonadaceae bacterium]
MKLSSLREPGYEIVRVAEELKVDLIALGTHGHSGWKRFTIGSVAELVVRYAPMVTWIK